MKQVHLLLAMAIALFVSSNLLAQEITAANAFPRDTVVFIESTINEELRAESEKLFERVLKESPEPDLDVWKLLSDQISKQGGFEASSKEAKEIITGFDVYAFGVTRFNAAEDVEVLDRADILLAVQHRHIATLNKVLGRAVKAGSQFVTKQELRSGVTYTTLSFKDEARDMPGEEAKGLTIQLATFDKFLLASNKADLVADGIERLQGMERENSLPANGTFKEALDFGLPQVGDRMFINVEEAVRYASQNKEANDVIDKAGLRSVRAISSAGYYKIKEGRSEGNMRVLLKKEDQPEWFKIAKSARTQKRLQTFLKGETLSMWLGATFSEEHRKKALDMIFESIEEKEGELPEEAVTLFNNLSDFNPQEMAVIPVFTDKSAIHKKAAEEGRELTGNEQLPVDVVYALYADKGLTQEFVEAQWNLIPDEEGDKPVVEFSALTDAPQGWAGFKALVKDGPGVEIFVHTKGNFSLVSTMKDVSKYAKRLDETSTVGNPRGTLMEVRFKFEKIVELGKKMSGDALSDVNLPVDINVERIIDVIKRMSYTLQINAGENTIGMRAVYEGLPSFEEIGDLVIDAMRQSALKDSEQQLKDIREMVMLYKILKKQYPESFEDMLAVGYLENESLKDKLDRREGSKQSFALYPQSADRAASQRFILAAQQEVFAGNKRVVVLLNGTTRRMTNEEFLAALKLNAEGKELKALEDDEDGRPRIKKRGSDEKTASRSEWKSE